MLQGRTGADNIYVIHKNVLIRISQNKSRFNLSRADGRVRIYHRKGERYADASLFALKNHV